MYYQTGPAVPIMHHQAKSGLAHVEEQTLIDYLTTKGVALPDEAESSQDRLIELKLKSMKTVMPDWNHTDACRALYRGPLCNEQGSLALALPSLYFFGCYMLRGFL